MSLPVALQLYTVRDPLAADFEGTLKEVAKIGYHYVEFAGLYNRDPKDVKRICDDLELTPVSSHMPLDALTNEKIDAAALQALVMGYHYTVCPFVGNEWRHAEGYQDLALKLNEIGHRFEGHSLAFGYHNHSFEFEKLEGGHRGMDIIWDNTGSVEVVSELDTYWVQHGGDDPVRWMEKLEGRVPLLHIKDMADTPERGFAEVGTGVMDWERILAKAPEVGVKYLIVEQDSGWKGSPLESAAISHDNLKKMLK